MNQSQESYNLRALLPQENYHVILNEQQRCDGYSRSQNIIKLNEQVSGNKVTRRKSCYCNECGRESSFQYKMMNILMPKKQIKKNIVSQEYELKITYCDEKKSTFFKQQSFNNMKISVPKTKTENSNIMLNIHGLQRAVSRQSSFVKLLADGELRSQRRITVTKYTLSERSSFNSVKSLNFTNNQSFQSMKRTDIQVGSPLSLFSPKRKNLQEHQRFPSQNITKVYHVNFKQSSRKLRIQPLKIQNQQYSIQCCFPKLSNNKQQ